MTADKKWPSMLRDYLEKKMMERTGGDRPDGEAKRERRPEENNMDDVQEDIEDVNKK